MVTCSINTWKIINLPITSESKKKNPKRSWILANQTNFINSNDISWRIKTKWDKGVKIKEGRKRSRERKRRDR